MTMQKINVNLFPKSGFVFKTADGTTIIGGTWPGVIARLRAYRKRNNQPPGDPEQEVKDQACANNPAICHQDDGQHAAAIKVATLKGRVLQWFSRIRNAAKREPILVGDQQNATARANICAVCPQAQALPDSGCSSCRVAVRELRNEVIGGKAVDPRLVNRGCNIIGADLATQVWLDEITIADDELPANCWRKRTI